MLTKRRKRVTYLYVAACILETQNTPCICKSTAQLSSISKTTTHVFKYQSLLLFPHLCKIKVWNPVGALLKYPGFLAADHMFFQKPGLQTRIIAWLAFYHCRLRSTGFNWHGLVAVTDATIHCFEVCTLKKWGGGKKEKAFKRLPDFLLWISRHFTTSVIVPATSASFLCSGLWALC